MCPELFCLIERSKYANVVFMGDVYMQFPRRHPWILFQRNRRGNDSGAIASVRERRNSCGGGDGNAEYIEELKEVGMAAWYVLSEDEGDVKSLAFVFR